MRRTITIYIYRRACSDQIKCFWDIIAANGTVHCCFLVPFSSVCERARLRDETDEVLSCPFSGVPQLVGFFCGTSSRP